ncbi:PDX2 Predicted glutamine amidotransferase involved in pyridoxine biosynthesis [Candidatus Nanopelagicaceae bacterium]
MKVGVLALQGDFREHLKVVADCRHTPVDVRRVSELHEVDALILPGGESTTIIHLAQNFGLFQPIREAIAQGLPVYGSCAGMILLADRIVDGVKDQKTFGGLDITVRRNAFGRQVDSFESDLTFNGASLHAVFIRAPWVEQIGADVEVLSTAADHAVAVRQGNLLATSFHPELTEDLAVHRYFFEEICKGR